jgi:hypothetical protein
MMKMSQLKNILNFYKKKAKNRLRSSGNIPNSQKPSASYSTLTGFAIVWIYYFHASPVFILLYVNPWKMSLNAKKMDANILFSQ